MSGLMNSRLQIPSILSRTKGLLGQRKLLSCIVLVVIVIRIDFRSLDFDIGFPLPKSHIHIVFEPVNVIGIDNGQTEEKGQVACFRVYV